MEEKPEFIKKLETYGIKVLMPIESVVYKYSSFSTAKKIVLSNCFLFSTPETFNDPFDLANGLVDKKATHEIVNNWLDSNNVTPENKKLILDKIRKDKTYLENVLNQTLNQFKQIAGITCFSKSFTKSLMWSHYAEKHSGVTLGFNIIPLSQNGNFTMLEVNYAKKIKPISFFLEKPFVFMYWLYTKSKVWSYEEEVRAVHMDRNGLIPFDKSCLKEVHFGLRTTEKQRKSFQNLLKKLDYRVERFTYMSIDPKTFDLKINEMTSS